MYDVNPLGPMMHLKDIEREALARGIASTKGGSAILDTAWFLRVLKWSYISARGVLRARDSANMARR
jgi:hypothetical protein